MFAALCAKADVRPIRVHDLRHSCATLLFTMGVEAATVQRVLRHSSVSIRTATCAELIESVQRNAVDTFFIAAETESDEQAGGCRQNCRQPT